MYRLILSNMQLRETELILLQAGLEIVVTSAKTSELIPCLEIMTAQIFWLSFFDESYASEP